MIGFIIIITFLGAIILLDKSAFGEFGISQPIVSCSFIGLIFGNFEVGLFLGVLLQLIWISDLPLGSKEPQDSETAGVVAIITFLIIKKFSATFQLESALFISLLFAGIAAILGQLTQKLLKNYNNRLLRYYNTYKEKTSTFETLVPNNIIKTFSKVTTLGLLTAFIRNLALLAFFVLITWILISTVRYFPQFTLRDLIIIPLVISASNLLRIIFLEKKYLFTILGIFTGIALWVLSIL